MSGDDFCPHCDVTNDLHDGPDSCEYAEAKARLLAAMDRAFGLVR